MLHVTCQVSTHYAILGRYCIWFNDHWYSIIRLVIEYWCIMLYLEGTACYLISIDVLLYTRYLHSVTWWGLACYSTLGRYRHVIRYCHKLDVNVYIKYTMLLTVLYRLITQGNIVYHFKKYPTNQWKKLKVVCWWFWESIECIIWL